MRRRMPATSPDVITRHDNWRTGEYLGAMSDPIVRRATRADVSAIVGLLMDDVLGAKREGANVTESAYEHAFAAIDKDPNHFLAVMELNGRVIGCLQLTFLPGLSRRGQLRGQIEAVRIAGD